jgi:ceramide glucosyltransferase
MRGKAEGSLFTDTLIDFAHFLTLLVAFASALGLAISAVQTVLSVDLLVRKASKCRRDHDVAAQGIGSDLQSHKPWGHAPLVSILKPISGLEDGLEENLGSFARMKGISYELIVSIADSADPALAIVKRALAAFPQGTARLIIGGKTGVANRKVERLIPAARVARGEILFISDSNVRVSPQDVARTIREFDDPKVGCVSNVFIGEGARSIGALIESLYLMIFVLPGNVLAAWAGIPCVVGKSMAITRRLYDKIGGFEAFGQLLAEDQSIALATTRAGYKVVLSPIVVRNVIVKRSLGQVLQRQVRWAKIRYSFSKPIYALEVLVNPVPLAVLSCLMAAVFLPDHFGALCIFAGFSVAYRLVQALVLLHASGAPISKRSIMLVPIQDFLQAAAQIAPYISKEVNWRGFRTRLGPDSLILAGQHGAHNDAREDYAPGVLSSTT